MANVRTVIVEDDRPIRMLLNLWLDRETDLDCVAAVDTLAKGRAAVRELRPDILITDLKLPDGSGLDLIRETRKELPDAEIMVISVLCDEATVVDAIRAGASGYLLKDALPSDFAGAIRDLTAGRSAISASIARYIVREIQSPAGGKAGATPDILTKRETDILWGIAKGLTYEDIANQLGISLHTVASHIKSIYRKLEVTSRGEAVFEAVSRQLIKL